MAQPSAPDFLVLHALRVKGFADVAAIAGLTALPAGDIRGHLEAARRAGLGHRRTGRISGWALTPAGRVRHEALLTVDLQASGAREAYEAAYPEFSEMNTRFKQVCSDWELRRADGTYVPNRHDDVAYDQSVLAALRQVDHRVQPLCETLAAVLARMSPYSRRLTAALTRIDAGDRDAFARPLADSYLDIWMELHQDLITAVSMVRVAVDA